MAVPEFYVAKIGYFYYYSANFGILQIDFLAFACYYNYVYL